MWEIKKVNLWDHKPRPWTVLNHDPCYVWCLFNPNGKLTHESWGFAGHDRYGKITFGADHDAIYSLLVSVPEGEDVRLYGPYESMKFGYSKVTPIDKDGGHTEVIKPEKWLK